MKIKELIVMQKIRVFSPRMNIFCKRKKRIESFIHTNSTIEI